MMQYNIKRWNSWLVAVEDELKSMQDNEIWNLVEVSSFLSQLVVSGSIKPKGIPKVNCEHFNEGCLLNISLSVRDCF